MKNSDNIKFILTPKGVLDDETVYTNLMLYMYKAGFNAMILDSGELSFQVVERVTPKKAKKK